MPSAALFALDRRTRDRFGYGQKVRQIQRRVPTGVVFPVPMNTHFPGPLLETLDLRDSTLHILLGSYDPDKVLHSLLKFVLNLIRTLPIVWVPRASFKGLEGPAGHTFHLISVDLPKGVFF